MPAEITYEVDDPVALITLQRPEALNALTYPMLAELRDAVSSAERDRRVVGIVITGAGRGFCSGLDASVLQQTATSGSSGRQDSGAETPGLFTWLLSVRKPVIAAQNGVAAGGGFVLAAMADLRFASTDAWFTTVFSKRGLIAEHGMTWILPRIVGSGRALDLLWSSRRVDAEEGYRMGFFDRVVPADDLLPAAVQYVRDLAEQVSPASLQDTKRLVYRHLGMGYDEALREADVATWEALDRLDAKEGAMALLERRQPSFPRLGEPGPSGPRSEEGE